MRAMDSAFSELSGKGGCALLVGSDSNVTYEAMQMKDTYCIGNIMGFLTARVYI